MATKAHIWSQQERAAALCRCPLFACWPEARIAELAAIARAEYYPRGAEIFAHDPERREAFVIASGEVEVSRGSAAGKKFVLGINGAPQILAIVRLLADPPIRYDYRAYEDSVLLHLPADGLAAILDAEPILWRDVALLMCARHGDSLRLLGDHNLGSLDQRMAATLVDLARIHGSAGGQGIELGLRLPQEQLGAMLGVTRQSVNKLLRGFEEAGLIAIDYNRITIRDPAALDAIAEAGG
ncbi:Crp/Fnr family transcriptional regulator [Sphingopyxis soli]|jgi:CRP-like cAMP-binding protein|uniref:Crp/Fnr family transcriptional regulator n=1 Tax=Sphingopyxis soli TaxID=592051 RepID=A0ABP3XR27_9SPHN|nr:Crp/Fnr family transcriptional regulator [Sphingopyxis soli]